MGGIDACLSIAHVQGAIVKVDYLRGFRGRVRSGAGFTSPGCTVGVGAGGCAPGGHNQISNESCSR